VKNRKLRKRFAAITAVYLVILLVLWLIYQNSVFSYVKQTATETAALIGNSLLRDLEEEFSRIKLVTSTLAGSVYVQDFLAETNKAEYYQKALTVSEIIRKTTYPHMGEDSVITIASDGSGYRFTGSVSNKAIESLREEAAAGAAYSVLELDGAGYFCIFSPVFLLNSNVKSPIGYVAALSTQAKVRRMLTAPDMPPGIDAALIYDGVVLFSSNHELDGKSQTELDRLYGSVTVSNVTGSNLYVAAAITNGALYYGESLFAAVSAISLAVLVITVFILYRVLSANVVSPTIKRADTMRMGLLNTQIDTHFIVNTISCIEGLAAQGKTAQIEKAAGNLAEMLKSRHASGAEINVFEQMEDIQRYIEIMNIRYSDKFAFHLEADDLFRYRMMGQILQPLVENSLTHGLGNKTADCRLSVIGRLEADCVVFEVIDNGKGMEAAALKALQDVLDTAEEWDFDDYTLKGVALVNIQRRIRARYGAKYGLTVSGNPGQGLNVTLRLPVIREKQPRE
jgi:hypothetical protein